MLVVLLMLGLQQAALAQGSSRWDIEAVYSRYGIITMHACLYDNELSAEIKLDAGAPVQTHYFLFVGKEMWEQFATYCLKAAATPYKPGVSELRPLVMREPFSSDRKLTVQQAYLKGAAALEIVVEGTRDGDFYKVRVVIAGDDLQEFLQKSGHITSRLL